MESLAPFRTIALIGRYKTVDVADSVRRLGAFLRARDCEVPEA